MGLAWFPADEGGRPNLCGPRALRPFALTMTMAGYALGR